ncbi:hypothetical protein LIPSTDRAFT_73111, partial [Lipomyces starkeyi NRRL Y-11557]
MATKIDTVHKAVTEGIAQLHGAGARSQQETRQLSSRISVMETGFDYIFHGGSLVTAAATAAASSSQCQNISMPHPMILKPILAADHPAPVPGSSSPAPPPSFLASSISAPAMPTLFSGRPRCPDQAPSHLGTAVVAPAPGATGPPIPKYKLPRYVLTVSELYRV